MLTNNQALGEYGGVYACTISLFITPTLMGGPCIYCLLSTFIYHYVPERKIITSHVTYEPDGPYYIYVTYSKMYERKFLKMDLILDSVLSK